MSESIDVKVKKISDNAIIPRYQTNGATGFDIHACLPDGTEEIVLNVRDKVVIGTGLIFSIPENYGFQIRSRSGLAAKNGIVVGNSPGTIDSDYVNELKIILYNHGDRFFIIKHGDRIAQGTVEKVIKANFLESELGDEEAKKDRGGGLGSTGVGGKMIKHG